MASFPISVPEGCPFPIQNIPFGIFSEATHAALRAGTAFGDWVLDLALVERQGLTFHSVRFESANQGILLQETLNTFAALDKDIRRAVRRRIIELLSDGESWVYSDPALNKAAFYSRKVVILHLPMSIPAFTDFSCFEEHVGNCFAISNIPFNSENNFYKSPMAYNGRASSVLSAGSSFARPHGVYKDPTSGVVKYQPSQKLDYEMELGILISSPLPLGKVVDPDTAATDHIFGYVLLNDWSARDIQMYESMPAGPFNCKAFASHISPWVLMPEALEEARTRPHNQNGDDVPVHIRHASLDRTSYDIQFDVHLARSSGKSAQVSRSNYKHSFFSPGQCVAHRASSGCGLQTGELLGGGTVSSPITSGSVARNGCLMEVTWDGSREVPEIGGTYLDDGDEVTMEAWVQGPSGITIGFGSLSVKVQPAREFL
ncbi:hypothetical protein BDV12DRAFT_191079 [Aspergillus spectabilis]